MTETSSEKKTTNKKIEPILGLNEILSVFLDDGVPISSLKEEYIKLVPEAADYEDLDKLIDNFLKENGIVVSKEEMKRMASNLMANSPEESYEKIIKAYLSENPTYYDTETKIWWIWDRKEYKWKMGSDVDILRNFVERYSIVKWLQPSIENKIIRALEVFSSKKPKELPVEWIQFKDTLVNIYTGEEKKATPEFFTLNPIPWKPGNSEDTPTIDKLFEDWVGKDNKRLLYEITAYIPYRKYRIHRIFSLIGTGCNGKTTLGRLWEKFVGIENTTSTTIDLLNSSKFEMAKLYGKLLVKISEQDTNLLKKTSILKSLTGEDPMPFEMKHKNPTTFMNYAKLTQYANTLRQTTDTSDGFYRRWIIIDFPNKFEESGIDPIDTIPDEEFENLCRKIIRILKEVLERGIFYKEGGIEEKKSAYQNKADLLRIFIETYYDIDPYKSVAKWEFQEKFEIFCKERNVQPMTARDVNKALKEEYNAEIKSKRFIDEDGEPKVWTFIFGLGEKDKPELEEKELKNYIKNE